jgi:hypothetical protein
VGNDEREHESQGEAADLRAQLKLAQERLATYQKFDRDIAENVRRSSELMLEAMQVRDRMEGEATEQARAHRVRLANRLQAMEEDLGAMQGQVATMLARVGELRQEFATERVEGKAVEIPDSADISPDPAGRDHAALTEPMAAPASAGPDAPMAIELIASGMNRAASALALQSHLRALSQVRSVDAREFSSGVLRLRLEVLGAIPDEDLLGWAGDDDVTVHRHQDNAIELRIGE